MTDAELLRLLEELGIDDPTFFYRSEEEKLEVVNRLNKHINPDGVLKTEER